MVLYFCLCCSAGLMNSETYQSRQQVNLRLALCHVHLIPRRRDPDGCLRVNSRLMVVAAVLWEHTRSGKQRPRVVTFSRTSSHSTSSQQGLTSRPSALGENQSEVTQTSGIRRVDAAGTGTDRMVVATLQPLSKLLVLLAAELLMLGRGTQVALCRLHQTAQNPITCRPLVIRTFSWRREVWSDCLLIQTTSWHC